ncbi:MAG TPA: hypothetical protein VM818_03150 [Vicinamibacterales bacterium]|nr:hypothetical protein [Vicinamibacterales bacterium]
MRSLIGVAGLVAMVCAVPAYLGGQGAAPVSQTYAPPRTSYGHPDIQGIWQVLNTATAWNLEPHTATWEVPAGLGVIVDPADGMIPYQPPAAAKRAENFKNREAADPLGKCFKPGVPRLTYLPFPFQIIQSPQAVTIFYEYVHNFRTIHLDRKTHVDGLDFWNGDSIGRWEGNTLVVDVANFNGQAWLDRSGNFHSEALHVVERYTRIDSGTMTYEVTLEDPKVFTRPWKMSMPLHLRREPNVRLLEYECHAYAEDVAQEQSR